MRGRKGCEGGEIVSVSPGSRSLPWKIDKKKSYTQHTHTDTHIHRQKHLNTQTQVTSPASSVSRGTCSESGIDGNYILSILKPGSHALTPQSNYVLMHQTCLGHREHLDSEWSWFIFADVLVNSLYQFNNWQVLSVMADVWKCMRQSTILAPKHASTDNNRNNRNWLDWIICLAKWLQSFPFMIKLLDLHFEFKLNDLHEHFQVYSKLSCTLYYFGCTSEVQTPVLVCSNAHISSGAQSTFGNSR